MVTVSFQGISVIRFQGISVIRTGLAILEKSGQPLSAGSVQYFIDIAVN